MERKTPATQISLKQLSLVARVTRNMILVLDETGAIQWTNPGFEKHTGYHLRDIYQSRPKALLSGPGTDPKTLSRITQKLYQTEQFNEEILLYTRAGNPFWAHLTCIPTGTEQDMEPGFVCIMSNISDTKENERNLRIAASVFDRSHEAILISDQCNRILDVNPAFSRITGYSRSDVLGLTPSILSSGRHSPAFYQSMWRSLEESDYWRGEIFNKRKNGEEFIQLQTITRVHTDEPGKYHHVATFTDITELKNHAKELDLAANYDELTGLPNLYLLKERLHQAQLHADRQRTTLSVCYLDLDGFSYVNRDLSRDAGNQALQILARRLTQNLHSGDIAARVGGDEFVIVLHDKDCVQAYERMQSTISQPVNLGPGTTPLAITASLGVTRYPEDRSEAEALIRHADQAMYAAKEKGRNQIHFFDPELSRHRQQKREQLTEISKALERGEFELHFQPQVKMADCKVTGVEALIRWNHPHKGMLYPDSFLPALKDSHLEAPLGEWVLQNAINQINLWQSAGEDLSVSVNISARHLMSPGFTHFLERQLRDTATVQPEKITLEVLESTALEDVRHAGSVLAKCQALGVQVALDDFGTGFSSLTYLRTLPVDLVKIDKSFVIRMLEDPSDRAIVESIIFLGQRFEYPVLAEGVETMAHARAMHELGCEFIQGYGVARPMPASEVPGWLKQWRKKVTTDNDADPALSVCPGETPSSR